MTDKELEHRLTRIEQSTKTAHHRLDEVEERQDNLEKLTTTTAVIAAELANTKDKVGEMSEDVKDLIKMVSAQGAQIRTTTATADEAADDIKEDQTARRKRWEKLAMEIGLKILAPIAAAIGGGIVVLMNLPS